MKNINLIPEEFSPNIKVLAAVKKLKKLSVFLFVVLVVASIGSTVSFIFLSRNSKKLLDNRNDLYAKLQKLSKVETSVVLVKDRVAKAKPIITNKAIRDNLVSYNSINRSLPEGINITSVDFSEESIKVDLLATDSLTVRSFVEYLLSFSYFKNIVINDASLNREGGYSVSLTLTK